MAEDFDPYRKWLGIPPEDQPANCYRLLGIGLFETDPDVISNAADRQMAHVRTFQTGKHGRLSQEVLNELAAARVCLLDPRRKGEYDNQLRAALKAQQPAPPPSPAPFPSPAPPTPHQSDKPVSPVDINPRTSTAVLGAGPRGTLSRTKSASQNGRARKSSRHLPVLVTVMLSAALGLLTWRLVITCQKGHEGDEPQANLRNGPGPGPSSAAKHRAGGNEDHDLPQLHPRQDAPRRPDNQTRPHPDPKDRTRRTTPGPKPKAPRQGEVRHADITTGESPAVSDDEDAFLRLWKLPAELPATQPSGPDDSRGSKRPLPGATTDRAAVPEPAEQQEAENSIRNEIFKEEFASLDRPSKKAALAKKLLEAGIKTQNDPTAAYVLLRLAGKLAVESGDATTALDAVNEMDRRYRIDPLEMKIKALGAASRANGTSANRKALVQQMLSLMEETLRADDFDSARRLADLARQTVAKARDGALAKRVVAQIETLDRQEALFDAVRPAMETLKTNRDDPQANQSVGKYVCWVKGDWQHGLPMLAKAADARLRELAKADLAKSDLAGANQTKNQLELGHGWWDLAEGQSDVEQEQIRRRAARWYKLAEPQLQGLTKAKVRQRLRQAGYSNIEPEPSDLPKFKGLECRNGKNKIALLNALGGNAESEAAVQKALQWLANHQRGNGSWCFDHRIPHRRKESPNPGTLNEALNAATAVALLPLLGAADESRGGEFRKNIFEGVNFLKGRMMLVKPNVGMLYEPNAPSHPLATMALCEATVIVRDKSTRPAAQAAVNFIVITQNPDGGWSQRPKLHDKEQRQRSDVFATGWNVTALVTARWVGLNVPPKTLTRAGWFLSSLRTKDRDGFHPNRDADYLDYRGTSVGFFCMMHLGWPRNRAELEAYVETLTKTGPRTDGRFYRNYYNTLVTRNFGGPQWAKWNAAMQDHLIAQQGREGPNEGSWYADSSEWGNREGGRLFCTAVAALTLEVYYRHPLIYQ